MTAWTNLMRWLWLRAYELESQRALHATGRRHLRSAACSIGLAVLAVLGG